MKKCTECGREYPANRVLCLDCNEILEEGIYLRIVWASVALAVVYYWFFIGTAPWEKGFIAETLMTATFLLLSFVLIWKWIKKIQQPDRRIVRELVSLYSDRTGRIIVVTASVFFLLIGLGVDFGRLGFDQQKESDYIRMVRITTILCLSTMYLLIYFYTLGLGALNMIGGNPMAAREMEIEQESLFPIDVCDAPSKSGTPHTSN